MPSLRELQTGLMDAVLGAASPAAVALLRAPEAEAHARLDLYRNNARGNFRDALASTFPVIERLVGADYFLKVARDLQHAHPSRSGDLLHAGAPFPGFLATLHAHDEFAYLADVARLEWAIQEVLLAPEHAPLDLQKMAGVAPSAYDTLRFELHPKLRLFESNYPALRIWEANVADAEPGVGAAPEAGGSEPGRIDLRSGGERLLVTHHRLRLRFHRVNDGEYRFADECRKGTPFAAAVAAATVSDAAFDAAAVLRRLVALEAIVDFRLH